MLVQSESEKLKEREMKHTAELKEWKESLAPRKRVSNTCFFIRNNVFSNDVFGNIKKRIGTGKKQTNC